MTATAPATAARPCHKLDLGGTRTHARRECVWVPGPTAECPTADGLLLTMLAKGVRADSGWDCDDYAVEELQRVGPPEPGRVFAVVNLDDGGKGEGCYEVFLADRGAANAAGETAWPFDRCDCPAGRHKVRCKHTDCLRAVVNKGVYRPESP